MFRKTKNNLDCILVDFQFARYIPSVYDVLLTMYLNLSYKDLNDNFKRLLDFYYECLKRTLEKHEIEIKMIISYPEFWKCVDFYKRLAIVEATWFGTIAFIGDDLGQKISLDEDIFREFYYFNRSKHLLEEMKRNEEYKVKITDLLRHIVILFK
nr:uncharacterized protein LOC111429433 [Onthophagus taurus]